MVGRLMRPERYYTVVVTALSLLVVVAQTDQRLAGSDMIACSEGHGRNDSAHLREECHGLRCRHGADGVDDEPVVGGAHRNRHHRGRCAAATTTAAEPTARRTAATGAWNVTAIPAAAPSPGRPPSG